MEDRVIVTPDDGNGIHVGIYSRFGQEGGSYVGGSSGVLTLVVLTASGKERMHYIDTVTGFVTPM